MRFLSLILALGMCGAARGDVIYSSRYLEPGEKLSRNPESRTFASNDARLEEVWNGSFAGSHAVQRREIRLTQFAQKRVVVMDADLKIYKVEPFAEQNSTSTTSISDLGEDPILGFKTRHFRMESRYYVRTVGQKTEGQKGVEMVSRSDVWVAPAATVEGFPTNFHLLESSPADREMWKTIQSGLTVRQIVSNPNQTDPQKYDEIYSREITSLTRCELDPTVFEIPGDYKEVSDLKFGELRAKRRFDFIAKSAGIDRQTLPFADETNK